VRIGKTFISYRRTTQTAIVHSAKERHRRKVRDIWLGKEEERGDVAVVSSAIILPFVLPYQRGPRGILCPVIIDSFAPPQGYIEQRFLAASSH
jgi:hypothetical protein